LLSYKIQFKAFLAYSSAGDFVVGLCVTLIVPIVHAALISWNLARDAGTSVGQKKCWGQCKLMKNKNIVTNYQAR